MNAVPTDPITRWIIVRELLAANVVPSYITIGLHADEAQAPGAFNALHTRHIGL